MLRQGGKSTSFVTGNRKTVHTTFNDGSELVEEYDVKTDELLGEERERERERGQPFRPGAGARPRLAREQGDHRLRGARRRNSRG